MTSGERDGSVVFPRRLKYLSALVTLLCGFLIIMHAVYPQFAIDTTTIALITILIFPWILPYIKKIKLPGGTELTFRDELQLLERAFEKSKIFRVSALAPSPEPLRLSLLRADPNLALAYLRIEIERRLREIARKRNLRVADERVSLRRVLNTLHSEKVIASSEYKTLNLIIDVCNKAVHAEKVDMAAASQIVNIGESALLYLDSLMKLN